MKKTVIYVHGKGGSADESRHYIPLFPDCEVKGLEYNSPAPWDAKKEFPAAAGDLCGGSSFILIANSMGAYFSMHALNEMPIEKAFFISPMTDMEKLILGMLSLSGFTENDLREKGELPSAIEGETLSWEYLNFVRENPINWSIPTEILYGEHDSLTSFETVSRFAEKIGAGLTVMPNGEHWFHTEEQMRFLDSWLKSKL